MQKLSVCIPTYNGALFLRQAIKSVLDQSYRDFELIIVDDASTDESFEITSNYKDPRIKYFRNPTRLGLVKNWNRCLELSNGRYINIMHQDDVMLPGNLSLKVDLLDTALSIGLVHTDIYLVNGAGERKGGHWLADMLPESDLVESGQSCLQSLIFNGNFICCPSVMVRRECFEKLGNFDVRLPFTADYEMWMRICTQYDIGYLNKELLAYRMHSGQETSKYSRDGKEVLEIFKAIRVVSDKYPGIRNKNKGLALLRWMKHSLKMGQWRVHEGDWFHGMRYFLTGLALPLEYFR